MKSEYVTSIICIFGLLVGLLIVLHYSAADDDHMRYRVCVDGVARLSHNLAEYKEGVNDICKGDH